ncbi:MAG: laminin G domain-containing protein, partial [Saprospiraceae bacterium]|nr:laminin G domain-containing protein [Saprospiraceae bacterium]
MKRLYSILISVCAWLITIAAQAQTPVANYSFNGNALDDLGNHAAIHGAQLTADRFGQANKAFEFDGVQAFLRASNSAALNSDYATVAFWVKPNELPVQGESYLISFGGWQERYKISLPSHGKCIWTTNNSSGISDMDAGAGNELVPGQWKHLAFVHDGAKDRIYVNGVQVAEKNVSGTLNSTSKPLGIGYDAVDEANYFNGAIDEVVIVDGALNAAQIAALYAAQSSAPVVPQGLVASYSFSGNTLDGSALANHAKAENTQPTTDRFGYGRSAYQFNGVDASVRADNSSPLNSANTTISFWIKPNSFPASGEAYLLSNGGWQERWKISMPNHGKPVFTTHSNGQCCSDMDSGTPLELHNWTHVVMVHDGSKDIIYFDGVQVAEKNVSGALDPTTHPLGIGYDPIDNGSFFDGAIDEVQIYNYALSAAEIAALNTQQNTFPGAATDLVAHYPLNGDGADATQFANNASTYGATASADRFGWANNAAHFDGTPASGIRADNSAALQSDFTTISFWIKPDEFPVSGEVYLLSSGGWQERWKISMPNHGKPVFTTHSNGQCCSDMDSGTPLTIGAWTHVVMVHDGAKDRIYFNGAQVNEKDVAGALDKTRYPLGIGYDPIDNGGFFKGAIDVVQIYNRALTAPEIAALYADQNQAPSVPGNLVADYPFTGNALDKTAYNNHAQAQGAQLTDDRFGKKNQAYATGAGQALVAANSPQQNSDYTTISFWIKPNSFPASGEVYLLSNGGWQERWKISMPNHGKPVFTTHSNGQC